MENLTISKFKINIAFLTVFLFSLVLSGCGINPLGEGEKNVELYTIFAKKMEKPQAIEKEESGKEGTKKVLQEGVAAVARAKKGAAFGWLIEKGVSDIGGGKFMYWEEVVSKPSEEDPDKLMTGRGEVTFGYPVGSNVTLSTLDTTKITDLYSFHFIGRETKNENFYHAGQICSLDVTVNFGTTVLTDIKPGGTFFWAKNISPTPELGQGDTASFWLDELDDANHIQYGEGHFLDFNTGKDEDGDGEMDQRPFDFDLEVHHKNSLDEDKPYHRYQDNEGVVKFVLPWGKSSDSLYFMVHFFPKYERTGEIRRNGHDGPVLVKFTHNEKTNAGSVTYYDDNGEEIGS